VFTLVEATAAKTLVARNQFTFVIRDRIIILLLFLFLGELLSERCRTDDLPPDVPILSLPPGNVIYKLQSSGAGRLHQPF